MGRSWRYLDKLGMTWLLIGIVVLGAAAALFFRGSSYIPLSPAGGFQINGEYPSDNAASVVTTRYGSFSGADAHTGTLTSVPFNAGFAIELAFDGYPAHDGESVRIERLDGSAQYLLPLPNAGEHWSRAVIPMPLNWIGQNVRLVAVDNATTLQGWIGVADVRRMSLVGTLRQDVRFNLLVATILAALLFVPCIGSGYALRRTIDLPNIFLFPASLLIAGCTAEAIFFLTMLSDALALIVTVAASLAGLWFTVRAVRRLDVRAALSDSDSWLPFALTLACALVYVIVVDLTVKATTSPAALLVRFQLPSDNVLPHLLADHIVQHLPPKPFENDWLSSDRPPLQAGFDLISRIFFPPGLIADDVRYEGNGMLLQATALGMLFCLSRLCKLSTVRSLVIVALGLCSGFFYINTVYIWPKLLSAALVAVACAIGVAPGRITLQRSLGIGVAVALGLLSHGGVAFTIPALIVALIISQRAAAVRIFAGAAAATVVLFAPWFWYQHVYDPPGDRLLKMHLAGHADVTDVPLTVLLKEAYLDVPFSTIVANKALNLQTVVTGPFPGNPDVPDFYRQFFAVSNAVGAVWLPFLAALALLYWQRFRTAGAIAWIALASLVFWCLAMYMPYSTSVHQGSYLTMLLIFLAGGIVATEFWYVGVIVVAIQVVGFCRAWLAPFDSASFWDAGGVITFGVTFALLAAIVYAGRAEASRNRRLVDSVELRSG